MQRRAALQQQHLVIIPDVHQCAQVRDRLVEDIGIHLAAVGHLHHRHARVSVNHQILLRLLQHRLCQHRRTGGKIIHTLHCVSPPASLSGSFIAHRVNFVPCAYHTRFPPELQPLLQGKTGEIQKRPLNMIVSGFPCHRSSTYHSFPVC